MINVSPSVIRIISLPEHTKDIHCKLLQVQHKLQICLYINPQIRKVLTQISLVYVKRKEKKRKIYRKYNSWQWISYEGMTTWMSVADAVSVKCHIVTLQYVLY